ncbi:RagB/SusD family nutrient uptake outer membrane protein [Marinoscillum sp. MHG1-6]|uniref:RagB/SusD family nutrient uptake outer membrane protein n=1 Tax=Marinoscillum sp. MHG1-6 TaxID=2959627 RepID=UPI002157E50E|nr:RagB/SusD family nutrient uptake outer membrane protein [Marinoscillum sp. MHG1-6]
MKTLKYIIPVIALMAFSSCKDFLETEPHGQVSGAGSSIEAAEALVVAAYAGIANDDMIGPITSMWVYGSVRSDDAYKGGGGVADVPDVNYYEQYNLTNPSQEWMGTYTWELLYSAISRTTYAIRALNEIPDADYADKTARIAEMRFLRGHSHFVLKKLYKRIPYIHDGLSNEDALTVSNTDLTNDELWNKIADDFTFAMQNLPEIQPEVGRANKYSAAAYLAKTRLFQAYEQADDNHAVTNINAARLQEVVDLCDTVINSGHYDLQPDFAENFLDGYDNDVESVWAAQFSISDGTAYGRLSFATGLNYPHGAPQYGCCGFHAPSHNLVNAFSTESGLPKFTTFNDVALTPEDFTPAGQTVDPRIDHTVGMDGHPYKYRNEDEYIFSDSWVRDAGVYGRFHSMKEQQAADCSCYSKQGPFIGSSKNIDFIRYADVLLWKAEALIELNTDLVGARDLINQVRQRAANSTGRTVFSDGSPASNYDIAEYTDLNYTWDQAGAREALRWERRLEFATEGQRFFDLVRWGIAEQTLNAYLDVEKTRRDFLSSAKFTANRDEYYPIPQREIDFTKGLYTQNPNY